MLCGRIAHPFGHRRWPIPLRLHQTCQSGTRRTERTNKPSTVVESPTQLRTAWRARCFKNDSEQNTIHKTEFANQERASTCVNLAENNTFRLDAYLHVFMGRIRVRPDALLHLRKHFYLEDIGLRSDGGGVGVKVLVMFLLCGRIGHSFGHN